MVRRLWEAATARAIFAAVTPRCLLRLGVFKLFENTFFLNLTPLYRNDVKSHFEHIHIDIR